MKSRIGIMGIIFWVALTTGCATFGPSQPTPEELAAQYLAQAQQAETQGDLVEAHKQYKLLLTVDPDNQQARVKSRQIGAELQKLAEKHYQDGMKYYQNGRYGPARQEFLTALRYNPDHKQSENMLTAQDRLKQIDRYVLHTIKPDESISTLAKIYYGDYRKFHLIALYNQLEDATKVRVGQKIKVPVIEGIPILVDASRIQTEAGRTPSPEPEEIITAKRFVTHTVKPEETLSRLAQKYYGDFKKYDLIARFNGMQATDSLRVGQELKIPEVAGVTFYPSGEGTTEMPDEALPAAPAPKTQPPTDTAETIPAEEAAAVEIDQAAGYRKLGIELYNGGDFNDAIIEFQKALNTNPDDEIAKNYMSLAYYELGYVFFNKADYSEAIKAFEKSREYDRSCERCESYIQLSEENFKDLHYRKGISYFGEEKLAEAISEWELVYDMDPNYKDVDKNIEKAKNLMNRLEEIKRSREKSVQD